MADRLWYDERLLIDGQLVAASGSATFENVNPATEKVIGVAADGSLADMDNAIGAARRAFDTTGWSTDVAFRLRCIRQLQEAFTRHLEEIRTGTIGVNGGLFYSPDVPFGGYRQSGIGREMGVAGFEEYLEQAGSAANSTPSPRYLRPGWGRTQTASTSMSAASCSPPPR